MAKSKQFFRVDVIGSEKTYTIKVEASDEDQAIGIMRGWYRHTNDSRAYWTMKARIWKADDEKDLRRSVNILYEEGDNE